MAKRNYKFTLEEIHTKANNLVANYNNESDEVVKNYILSDLVNLTDELVRTNIYKFKIQMNVPEMDDEEAYCLCMGSALLKALSQYDSSRGVYFTTFWHTIMNSLLLNELKRLSTKKEKMNRNDTISGNASYSFENGAELFSVIATEEDVCGSVCNHILLDEMIRRFEETDQYGKLIRCEMLGNKRDKTKAILKILGASQYGDVERQKVRRTKLRFRKFLIENNCDITVFM